MSFLTLRPNQPRFSRGAAGCFIHCSETLFVGVLLVEDDNDLGESQLAFESCSSAVGSVSCDEEALMEGMEDSERMLRLELPRIMEEELRRKLLRKEPLRAFM